MAQSVHTIWIYGLDKQNLANHGDGGKSPLSFRIALASLTIGIKLFFWKSPESGVEELGVCSDHGFIIRYIFWSPPLSISAVDRSQKDGEDRLILF